MDPLRTKEPLLAASGLSRRKPATADWLLRNVSLKVYAGDRFALVGPTGSGKSLFLRAVALLDPVDEGEIYWCGEPVEAVAVPEFRSHVSYLQQRSPVIEGTVEDNLEIPFSFHIRRGRSLPRDRLTELLSDLGKDSDFLASQTRRLSGGERQIVGLLRALLVSPTVLLLDEPSASLDPNTTRSLERLVDSWQAGAPNERAYIWVSHDDAQAQRVGDRIISLEEGRIVATQ